MAKYQSGGKRYDPSSDSNPGAGTSEREDLANFISMITRDETKFLSSIGKTKATSVYHEWQTDELRAPAANAKKEGYAFQNDADYPGDNVPAAANSTYRTRLGNYTQIFTEELEVTGTKRAVDQAGVADEYAYQMKKKGTELRRDQEYTLLQLWQDSSSGATRTLGSVTNWLSNDLVVDATANGGAGGIVSKLADADTAFESVFTGSGDGTLANDNTLANASRVDIELSHVDIAMQAIYEEGGKAGVVMLSPTHRRTFSSKAQGANANVRRDIGMSGELRASVDVYMSDFGDVRIEPNYIMGLGGAVGNRWGGAATGNVADSWALVYDPQWFAIASLRPLHEVDLGQVGDTTRGLIVEECTLEVKNPQGFAGIVGLGA